MLILMKQEQKKRLKTLKNKVGKQLEFLDAGQADSIQAAVDFTIEQYGTVSVLVNNVGLTNLHSDLDVVNLDLEECDRRMDVNLKSVLLGSRFAIPHMIKAGVVNLTRYIAAQYGKDHIRCNGVAPGLILTPAAKNNMPQAVLDIFGKFNALPYHGEADDIGYTVLFHASGESQFITGQTIQVEGGHYIANPSISDYNDYVTKAKSN
ncbi:SDR family oxidoreductase [Peribacillus frigoritolerans]|uniref:SDR family oxidoreductase n=1 Tax=Peribacillus frigoritolerans TaxID=450367 RepID=UPI002163530A|nr:SDR family oxidoreductase [Peribacillus frigoritolerans]